MKRLLAVGITLGLVLGLAAGSSAFDKQMAHFMDGPEVQAPARDGGKALCWIWNHDVWHGSGNSNWYASFFDSCCGFKVLMDPYGDIMIDDPSWYECDETVTDLFPFNVESYYMYMWAYTFGATPAVDIIYEIDIEELGPWEDVYMYDIVYDTSGTIPIDTLFADTVYCPTPGTKLWTSDPLVHTLYDDDPGDGYIQFTPIDIVFPSVLVY